MTYEINQQEFNNALKALKRNVDGRPSHPVLGMFLLEFEKPSLKVSAIATSGFNQRFARASATLDLTQSNQEGYQSLAVPAKELSSFVATLPKGCALTLSVQSEYALKVEAGSISTVINGANPSDFPIVTILDSSAAVKENPISLPASLVATILKDTLYSASRDSIKVALSSVSLTMSKDKVTAIATDGHRLSCIEKVADIDGEVKFEIPVKIADQLSKLLGSNSKKLEGKTVQIYQVDEGSIGVSYDSTELTFHVNPERYPECLFLFPDKFQMSASFNTAELTGALARAEKFANMGNGAVKFEFNLDAASATISCDKFKEEVNVGIEGGIRDNAIAFNVNYLLDALKGSYLKNSETLRIDMNSPTTAAVVEPYPFNASDSYRYLIMPVQLRSFG
jgi:DNA polymerase-3 subunit beta